MRLFSTPESVRRGELSLLAIAETIAASGLSFWLAWRLGSIQHIVLASALVPFLLLRTRLSTWYAIRLFRKIGEVGLRRLVLYLVSIIKLWATTRIFLRFPGKSVRAIPANFYRDVVTVDLFFAQEFFPGSEEVKRSGTWFRNLYEMLGYAHHANLFSLMLNPTHERLAYPRSYVRRILIPYVKEYVKTLAPALPMIFTAIAYRWALKSVSIFWLPLIWIVFQSRPRTQIITHLIVMTRSAWAKTVLVYSALVLLAFVAKVALYLAIWHLVNLDWLGPLGVAATRLAAPFELPLWQFAGALNAVLTWIFFYLVDQHILAHGTTEEWPEVWVRRGYAFYQVARTTLTLYVIACTFYIAAAVAWQTEWPPIRFVLFPWAA